MPRSETCSYLTHKAGMLPYQGWEADRESRMGPGEASGHPQLHAVTLPPSTGLVSLGQTRRAWQMGLAVSLLLPHFQHALHTMAIGPNATWLRGPTVSLWGWGFVVLSPDHTETHPRLFPSMETDRPQMFKASQSRASHLS